MVLSLLPVEVEVADQALAALALMVHVVVVAVVLLAVVVVVWAVSGTLLSSEVLLAHKVVPAVLAAQAALLSR